MRRPFRRLVRHGSFGAVRSVRGGPGRLVSGRLVTGRLASGRLSFGPTVFRPTVLGLVASAAGALGREHAGQLVLPEERGVDVEQDLLLPFGEEQVVPDG